MMKRLGHDEIASLLHDDGYHDGERVCENVEMCAITKKRVVDGRIESVGDFAPWPCECGDRLSVMGVNNVRATIGCRFWGGLQYKPGVFV